MPQQEDPSNRQWEEERAYLASFDAGKDDNSSMDAGQVAEIAEVDLGQDQAGIFSEFDRMALGGRPDDQLQTRAGRASGDLQDGGDTDVAAGTNVRIRITDSRRNQTYAKTPWMEASSVEASSIENLPVMQFEGFDEAFFAKEGRVFVFESRNMRQSHTIATTNTNFDFPVVGGY